MFFKTPWNYRNSAKVVEHDPIEVLAPLVKSSSRFTSPFRSFPSPFRHRQSGSTTPSRISKDLIGSPTPLRPSTPSPSSSKDRRARFFTVRTPDESGSKEFIGTHSRLKSSTPWSSPSKDRRARFVTVPNPDKSGLTSQTVTQHLGQLSRCGPAWLSQPISDLRTPPKPTIAQRSIFTKSPKTPGSPLFSEPSFAALNDSPLAAAVSTSPNSTNSQQRARVSYYYTTWTKPLRLRQKPVVALDVHSKIASISDSPSRFLDADESQYFKRA